MRIDIKTIPHKDQRYDTLGDWQFGWKKLNIRVSDMGNADYEFLVALHELIEAWVCRKTGVTQEQVDSFDINYKGDGEPGDDPAAPYHLAHLAATQVERAVATLTGTDWGKYMEATALEN